MKKNSLLFYITTGILAWILLVFIFLASCQPPEARAFTVKFSLLDTLIGDVVPGDGIWMHPIDSGAGLWVVWDRGSLQADSILTTYGDLKDLKITLDEGTHQIDLYPDSIPIHGAYQYWHFSQVWHLKESTQIMLIYPDGRDQFAMLLDTVHTWDFKVADIHQGFRYQYYKWGEPSPYWPHYEMDFYGGLPGFDSTRYLVRLDTGFRDIDTVFMEGESVVFQRKLKPGKVYSAYYIIQWALGFHVINKFSMGWEPAMIAN